MAPDGETTCHRLVALLASFLQLGVPKYTLLIQRTQHATKQPISARTRPLQALDNARRTDYLNLQPTVSSPLPPDFRLQIIGAFTISTYINRMPGVSLGKRPPGIGCGTQRLGCRVGVYPTSQWMQLIDVAWFIEQPWGRKWAVAAKDTATRRRFLACRERACRQRCG
jgi:hypothetical protein